MRLELGRATEGAIARAGHRAVRLASAPLALRHAAGSPGRPLAADSPGRLSPDVRIRSGPPADRSANDARWSARLRELHAPWLPTMDVRAVPVLDVAGPFARRRARARTRTLEPAYREALQALPPAHAARIRALREAVGGSPVADAAVASLAASARLHPALLDAIDGLRTGPLAPGVDRPTLLRDVLAEVDDPARIDQGIKLTCESASVQKLLAHRDPAGYVRLVADLASPEGTSRLAGGDTVQRVASWRSPTDVWRSSSSRLVQPAFETYGLAPTRYSNTLDPLGHTGLSDPQVVRLASAVFGEPFAALTPGTSTQAARMAAFRAATGEGWHVPVWLNWLTGHVVLGGPEAGGRVPIDNPMGLVQTMAPDAFQAALHSVYVPARYAPATSG